MYRGKIPNNRNSFLKAKWFRIELILYLIIPLAIFNYGCDKEDDDTYYVQYKVDSSALNQNEQLNVVINKENNEKQVMIIAQNTKWQRIIGPVSKGFKAELSTSKRTGAENIQIYAEIGVSKNNSPFAIKASDGHVSFDNGISIVSMTINYTIDC